MSLFVGGLLWPIALIWSNYNYKTTELVGLSGYTLESLEYKGEEIVLRGTNFELDIFWIKRHFTHTIRSVI